MPVWSLILHHTIYIKKPTQTICRIHKIWQHILLARGTPIGNSTTNMPKFATAERTLLFHPYSYNLWVMLAVLIFTPGKSLSIFCVPEYMRVPFESAQTWPVRSVSMHVLMAVIFGFWQITAVCATQLTSPITVIITNTTTRWENHFKCVTSQESLTVSTEQWQ